MSPYLWVPWLVMGVVVAALTARAMNNSSLWSIEDADEPGALFRKLNNAVKGPQ